MRDRFRSRLFIQEINKKRNRMYLIVVTHDTIPDARITHVWAHDIVDTLPTSLSYFVPPLHIKADRKQNIEHKGLKAARHMQ